MSTFKKKINYHLEFYCCFWYVAFVYSPYEKKSDLPFSETEV